MNDIIFQIRDLNLFYGNKQALHKINIDIKKNHITALIGPSGCGKSTFLRCLNRMNDVNKDCVIHGLIMMEGENIYSDYYDVNQLRTRVGMVFQKPNPFPMSIFDNVCYGLRCAGIKKKSILVGIVEDALKKAALWDEVKNRLSDSALSLSGGQQQRLCIARAIAMSPDVILMDEPTSALDPIATNKIEELIESLKKEYTIIIVTHSMQQASRISDETIFFLMGEVIEANQTIEFFQQPKDPRSEAYITGRYG